MPVALETFVKQLTDSGVLAAGKLDNFIPPKAHPKDAQELAKQLVKQKQLTKYQAAEIYQGRAKSLILGGYTILDKIGAGGMGQVFKAEHRKMHRTVAIKMLPPAVTKDALMIARFQREVEAAARLEHPNIVTAYDADEAAGVHFLVMQFVDGSDLSVLVKQDGPVPLPKAVNYILQAARGLEYAHNKGIIHRDIKPANLLLSSEGTIKILDMGLARIQADGSGETQAELTGTGAVMGTVDYMSPEQAFNSKHADARADIYSLGCTFYYLLAGKPAYDGETVIEKILAHREKPIPSLKQLQGGVPKQIDAIYRRMVAKNAEDRYQSMSEVVADLQECVSETSAVSKAQTAAAAPAENSNLSFLTEGDPPTHHPKTAKAHKPASKPKSAGGWSRRQLLVVGGGLAGALILLAGVLLMLRTKDGTLVVEAGDKQSTKATLEPAQDKPWLKPAFKQWEKDVAAKPAEEQVTAVRDRLVELNPGFDGKETHEVAGGVVTKLYFDSDQVADISPVRALTNLQLLLCSGSGPNAAKLSDLSPLKGMQIGHLYCGNSHVSDLSPLIGLPLTNFECANTLVSDLTPLEGMKLTDVNCWFTKVADLSPLRGMPLTFLACWGTPVSDLSPLRGMKLTKLNVSWTQVSDLSPLEGMPLAHLQLTGTPVSDLTPLQGMNLSETWLTPQNITKGMDVIRAMTNLQTIRTSQNDEDKFAPAEFWKKYDAGAFGKPESISAAPDRKLITTYLEPAFKKWEKEAAKLPAENQVKAVAKKLQELNPGFDGKVAPIVEAGVVTHLQFATDYVANISPLRALSSLKHLKVCGYWGKSIVSDLSPLQGMRLETLDCGGTPIVDLSPLNGMPLMSLRCGFTKVTDLSPLRTMPLTELMFDETAVSDLSPLEGMRLEIVQFTPQRIAKGIDVLRQMASLTTLGLGRLGGNKPFTPAEFWKKYDAGDFGKPESSAAAPDRKLTTTYLEPAFKKWEKETAELPAEKQVKAVAKKLQQLNPGYDGKVAGSYWALGAPKIENGVVTGFGICDENVTDISPVRAFKGLQSFCAASPDGIGRLTDLSPLNGMPLTGLICASVAVSDLSPLKDMPLSSLYCHTTGVSDLSPLRGMKLTHLSIQASPLVDLSPLQGMPLTELTCGWTRVADLSPLKGMPLTLLFCPSTAVSDLSPLKGTRLAELSCDHTQVSDLSPLTGMSLKTVSVTPENIVKGLDIIRQMKSLEKIGVGANKEFTPAEFWKKYDIGDFGKPDAAPTTSDRKLITTYLEPAFKKWEKDTAAKPAEQQAKAVGDKLVELNPGFDGKVKHEVEGGIVTKLYFDSSEVTDLSPLRALKSLGLLACSGAGTGAARLSDLSPLKGISLGHFYCSNVQVTDLSPLAGMPLTIFDCHSSPVSDLTPLEGMQLTSLGCWHTKVSDLSPLRGMPLTNLNCFGTPISDFSPLQGMKLSALNFSWTHVSDLAPLEGMPLTRLEFVGTPVSNLTPLQGINLSEVWLTPQSINKGMKIIRAMTNLHAICTSQNEEDQFTPAEFWKKYDAGVFGPPDPAAAAPTTPERKSSAAYVDPAFKKWEQDTAKLSPEAQIKAVVKKLQELNPGYDGKVTGGSYRATDAPWIENGAVTEFGFADNNVTDISPVRAFKSLKSLMCVASADGQGRLSDLSPIAGMPLTGLILFSMPVSELSPLKGMPLVDFACYRGKVSDLSPLKGMKLSTLSVQDLPLADLSPLEGMPLTNLTFGWTQVADLSPLKGMPLTRLGCVYSAISDLSPLKGIKLVELYCDHTRVSNLSPLAGMNLKIVSVTPKDIVKGLDVIRQMNSLEKIRVDVNQDFYPVEFWQKYDAGEFK